MNWRTDACAAFDEIENAHKAVGGTKPGRRFLTQQLNYAYTMLLAARFQGFARALHAQTADAIALGARNATYAELLYGNLTNNTALERRGNDERRKKLWALITWRNAIAHDDIDAKLAMGALEPVTISLSTCRSWRSALNILATSLDKVAADRCQALGLSRPW